mgnify:CR=1 FL=1
MIHRAAIIAAIIATVANGEIVPVRIPVSNVGTAAVATVATTSDRGILHRLSITNSTLLPVQIESQNDGVQIYATTGLVGMATITNLATPIAGFVIKSGLATNLNQTTNTITIKATLEK